MGKIKALKATLSEHGLLVVGSSTTPFLLAYRWSRDGFGAQFLVSPALPAQAYTVAVSPSGAYVVATHITSSPYLSAYPVSLVGGFGTKLADPATLPSSAYALAFTPDGEQVLIGDGSAPYAIAYEWADAFGAKFADPGTPLTASVRGMDVHPDGNAVAVGNGTVPMFLHALKWSDSGWGTTYTDPVGAAMLGGPTNNTALFSPTGGGVVIGDNNTPYIHGWPWTYAGGFGTKYANPATLPPAGVASMAFNAAGTVVAVGHYLSPYMSFYAWDDATGWGAKYADPATLPTAAVTGIKFLAGDRSVVCTMGSSPYIEAWAWNDTTGFGAKYANPGTLPPGACTSIAFLPA